MPDKNKPGRGVGPAPGSNQQNNSSVNSLSPRTAASSGYRRRPPYARQLVADRSRTVMVVTGSDGWPGAASGTWFVGRKLMLPYGEDPAGYDWSAVAGFADVVICSFGRPEPVAVITALAAILVNYVERVIYLPPGGRIISIRGGDHG
jgi:hypothetical protein